MRKAVMLSVAMLCAGAVTHAVFAQSSPHPHVIPTRAGQEAFGTIAEIVRLLDADPTTDWTRVNLERLRQHLIDMDEVVMRAEVKHTAVPGGVAIDITGPARTERAIRAMIVPHARQLDRMPAYTAKADGIRGGVRLTVTTKDGDDTHGVARVRGLGFAGLLTEGAHHAPHHLSMAKSEPMAHAP